MVLLKFLCVVLAVITVNFITAEEPTGPRYSGPGGYGGAGGPGGYGAPGGPGGDGGSGGSSNDDRYRQIVRCNYTEQPGRTCVSCNQTLICSGINLGVLRTCRRDHPYCNQGECTKTPADGCNGTSSL